MEQTSLERLLSTPKGSQPVFLADGHLAWISDRGGFPQVWVEHREGDMAPALPLSPDLDRVENLIASPAGDGLVLAHDRNGDEQTQLRWLDPETGEYHDWTAGWEDAKHHPGKFSSDGRFFYLSANRRDRRYFDLYRQPVEGGEAHRLWGEDVPGVVKVLAVSPCGGRILFNRQVSTAEYELFQLEVDSGHVTALHSNEDPATYDAACWLEAGNVLLVLTDRWRDFKTVYQLDIATERWTPQIFVDHDIEEAAASPDRRRLACLINTDGVSVLRLYDVDTWDVVAEAPFEKKSPAVLSTLCFSPDGKRLAFARDAAAEGTALCIWNIEDGTVAPAGGWSGNVMGTGGTRNPELVEFPSFDGRQIPAWFYSPQNSAGDPAPAVVFVHGGPASQYRPTFDPFAQYLCERGYAFLAPNVRGSTGYGKAYTALDDKRLRLDAVEDLGAAARWLREHANIDANRVAVYGRSYGGFMVLATLTRHPELWAAGIDIVGIGNMVTFLENTSDYRRPHREAEYGSLAEDRDFLEEISPLNQIDKIRAPLLIVHGRNDPRVPVGEAEQLAAALKARGMSAKLLIFEDEGHVTSKLPNKITTFRAAAEFLNSR